jgi:hypothetical protein
MDTVMLNETFSEQADWREQKAKEFPDDDRNAAAAKLLRAMAQSSSAVPQDLLSEVEALSADSDNMEAWSEKLRQVGFGSNQETAEGFLLDYIAGCRSWRATS